MSSFIPLCSMIIAAGILVNAESDDSRCDIEKWKNWPKKCLLDLNFSEYIKSRHSAGQFRLRVNPAGNSGPYKLFRVLLQEPCDCSCNCNCGQMWPELGEPRKNGIGNGDMFQMNAPQSAGCYQYVVFPGNISSCCINFPGAMEEQEFEENFSPSLPSDEHAHEEDGHALKDAWLTITIVIGVIFCCMLIAILLYCCLKRFLFIRQQRECKDFYNSNMSLSSHKEGHLLLVYAKEDECFEKIVGCLKNVLGDALNGSGRKVYDVYQCIGEICDAGVVAGLTQKINESSMVLVLISPRALMLQSSDIEANQMDIFQRIPKYFFSNVLAEQQIKEKLIFVSLDIFGAISLNYCGFSAVYSLPTKLEDLIKLLGSNTTLFDDKRIQTYQRELNELCKYLQIQQSNRN